MESNQNSDPRSVLIKYAANILNQRPYLSSKLSEKLFDRAKKLNFGDVTEIISQIIYDLSTQGYLNDEYLIDGQLNRLLSKGYGPQYIKAKLRSQKIPNALISQKIASLKPKDILVSARSFLIKKRYSDVLKAKSALFRRGFDIQTINHVFDSESLYD